MVVKKVIVLGGGSAGFMAAIALKCKVPGVDVLVIRSKEIGVIGVGEGSTVGLTKFLHEYLCVGMKKFHEVAQPTWKLGLKFVWGKRPWFYYGFGAGMDARYEDLPKAKGFYCDESVEYADLHSALMAHDKVFERAAVGGGPKFHDAFSYHFENERFVEFLEGYAVAKGVRTLDDTVLEVRRGEAGVEGLVLRSGVVESADLYVDCSGFASVLLGRTLGEPFVSFSRSLFCDRAVVGGWERGAGEEVIRPYTACETMESGWCWQIEHERRVHRGYVYSSAFTSDAEAEGAFRAVAPKVGATRVVRFTSGRYERAWVRNVVAVGNASGFVEPLEATALGVIAMQARLLADTLVDSEGEPTPTQVRAFNDFHQVNWDCIRGFIAMHYKFNDRLETPFWRTCRAEVELGRAEPVVEYYRENGPSNLWETDLFHIADQFRMAGYSALLVGMRVPYRTRHEVSDGEWRAWNCRRAKLKEAGVRGVGVREGLELVRSPRWRWG